MTITETKKVYLDGQEYTRVFFDETNFFDDVPTEIYREWVEAWDHVENS